MNGFITQPRYITVDDKPLIQLFGKLENGETFRADINQETHFFIQTNQVTEARKLATNYEVIETKLRTLDDKPVTKIVMSHPKDVPLLRKAFMDNNIPCYEADIRFEFRYLIDNNIKSSIDIKGKYEKGTGINRIYTNPTITPSKWKGELTTLSIDIETDKKANEIWCVALTTGKKHYKLIVDREVKGSTNCKTEVELLEELSKNIIELDPDIITGWNVVDFDLKVLQKKYQEHNIPWKWGRGEEENRLRIESEYYRASKAEITGRQVLDGIELLRMNFVKLDNYTLENAAQQFLGKGKLFTGKNRFEHIEESYNNNPEELLKYNLLDAELVLDILEKTNILSLVIKRSLITGMPLDRVRASIASLDMIYLPRLREQGIVAPTAGYVAKDEPITGGFVMNSEPGIYDYVIVCDFKSLYPSIIRTLNIDPVAFRPGKKLKKSNKEFIVAENGAVFSQEPGLLPTILQELWDIRDEIRKEGDEIGRYAIKILMNSFFGVLASPNCRFFSMDMANAITTTGQHIIKETAALITKKGYSVIYGDTDSIFIDLHVTDKDEADRIGKGIQDEVNAFFDSYVQNKYQTNSYLDMEYEKMFTRFLMPQTRGGEGSKKRYAGLVLKDGKEDIEFTGLEFVRRDWTALAKEFQLTLLNLIFHKENPSSFIKEFVDKIKAGEYDDLLVYRKALRKRLEEYTKTTPPHVKAARLLDNPGKIIEYVMTVSGPEPLGKVTHSLDYDHYIEKQVKPIADSVLVFYETSFSDVLKGTEQKGLFEF